MTLYKVLDTQGNPMHGGSGPWSLPTPDGPGEWMPPILDVVLCRRGYHLCRPADLILWLGPAIYEAEGRGEHLEADGKTVWAEARLLRCVDTWTERTVRLFVADCAEHVLPLFEGTYPDDRRPRQAIEAARAYARGELTDAAWAAAGDAAWAAAGDAERAWQTERLMNYLRGEIT